MLATHSPLSCLVAAFRRLNALMPAIATTTGRQLRFAVVARGLIPHVVGHRVGTVGETGGGLRERQRGALGVAEIRRLAPRRDGVDALAALPCVLEVTGVEVYDAWRGGNVTGERPGRVRGGYVPSRRSAGTGATRYLARERSARSSAAQLCERRAR